MLNQIIDALTQFITQLYITTGLFGIVLAMALESCCIPLPSEIVMPLAGIMIADGKILKGVPLPLSLVIVGLAGALGCLLGSIVAYWIGYKGGRPLMLKYGRYVLISQHDADLADRFFQRWGSATAFFSRLLPVVRTYISLPAGISKMPFARFCIYTFLGSFPWCVLLAYAGVVLGGHMDTLSPFFHAFDVVIVVALVILVGLYIWRHIRNDRLARVEHAIEEANTSKSQSVHGQSSSSPNWSQIAQGQHTPPPTPSAQNWTQAQQPPAQTRNQPQQWPPQADDDRTIYRR